MQKRHVLSTRQFLFFSFFALAVFSIAISAEEPLLVTISKETTGITTPLKANGYPDYLGALNAVHSKGVNSNNNLAVSIWNTIGTADMATELIAPYFEHLHIPPPPRNAKYYQSYNQWYQKTLLSQEKTSNLTPNEIDILRKSLDNEYDICILQPWTSPEFPQMAMWLKFNQRLLVNFVSAANRRSRFYSPYVVGTAHQQQPLPELMGVLLPTAQQSRELARGLRLFANNQIATDDLAAAIATSNAIHRLGQLSSQGATLVEGLVGIAIDRIGFKLDELIIKNDDVTDAQLQLLDKHLRALPPISSLAGKIDVTERYIFLDTTISLARNGPQALTGIVDDNSSSPSPALNNILKGVTTTVIDWDHILRTGNYWYDEINKVNSIKSPQQRKIASEMLELRITETARDAANPASIAKQVLFSGKSLREITSNQIANILVGLLLPALTAAAPAETRRIAVQQVTLTSIAITRYKKQHDNYPDKLTAVKGVFIDELPKDPFTGRPLKYLQNANGVLLYSFGANMTDDGGHTRADSDDGDDIAFRVDHHTRPTPTRK
jgi:hypothetical protein